MLGSSEREEAGLKGELAMRCGDKKRKGRELLYGSTGIALQLG